MQCSQVVSQVLDGRASPMLNLDSQAGAGNGEFARSLHHGVMLSSALVSELVAVAVWTSWQSLACLQY